MWFALPTTLPLSAAARSLARSASREARAIMILVVLKIECDAFAQAHGRPLYGAAPSQTNLGLKRKRQKIATSA
jgi:hypothetical protein